MPVIKKVSVTVLIIMDNANDERSVTVLNIMDNAKTNNANDKGRINFCGQHNE